MVALNWSQFEKRLRPNLKTFWQMVVNNRRFVLEKATKDWDGSTKLTEGIQLTGIVYESKKIEKGKEVMRFEAGISMRFNEDEMLEMGIKSKKKLTPATISKKYPLNEYIGISF